MVESNKVNREIERALIAANASYMTEPDARHYLNSLGYTFGGRFDGGYSSDKHITIAISPSGQAVAGFRGSADVRDFLIDSGSLLALPFERDGGAADFLSSAVRDYGPLEYAAHSKGRADAQRYLNESVKSITVINAVRPYMDSRIYNYILGPKIPDYNVVYGVPTKTKSYVNDFIVWDPLDSINSEHKSIANISVDDNDGLAPGHGVAPILKSLGIPTSYLETYDSPGEKRFGIGVPVNGLQLSAKVSDAHDRREIRAEIEVAMARQRGPSEGAMQAQRDAAIAAAERQAAQTHEARDEAAAQRAAAIAATERYTASTHEARDERAQNPNSLNNALQQRNATPTSHSGNLDRSYTQDAPADHGRTTPSPSASKASGSQTIADAHDRRETQSYTPSSSSHRDTVANRKDADSAPNAAASHAAQAAANHQAATVADAHDRRESRSGGGSAGKPVLLDLSGNGLTIEELQNSSMFYDMNGDGQMYHTAWAGKGNAVLAIDANGDGKISGKDEVVFTEWDASADSDLAALRNVFDTNHNGKLDAGDARFGEFRVMVNGVVKKLTDADIGITSIDLIGKGSGETYSDGSKVTSTSTFTRTVGGVTTTGKVGDATFAADVKGTSVKSTSVTNANGSVTATQKMFDTSNAVTGTIVTTTSADGNSNTTQFDDDGDGLFERSVTDVTTVAAAVTPGVAGVITEAITEKSKDGRMTSRTTRVTSADRKTLTVTRDLDGNRVRDESDVIVIAPNGSQTITTTQYQPNGTTIDSRKQVTSSVDGLTVTTKTNIAGRLDATNKDIWDRVVVDATKVDAAGVRTKTVMTTARPVSATVAGVLLSKDTLVTSANGLTRTETIDADGDGLTDSVETDTTVQNADKSNVLTVKVVNRDGTLRSNEVTTTSGDGLTTTTQSDHFGLGSFDTTVVDSTVVNADQSRTETVITNYNDGSLARKTVSTYSATGRLISQYIDSDGNSRNDKSVESVFNADGSITTISKTLRPDWSVVGGTSGITISTSTTSADGLTTDTVVDLDGNNRYFETHHDKTVINANGSRTETTWDASQKTSTSSSATGLTTYFVNYANAKKVVTSADGLRVTTYTDLDIVARCVGSDPSTSFKYNDIVEDVISVDAKTGVRTETITKTMGTSTVHPKTTKTTSADRLTETVNTDTDGDGKNEQSVVSAISATGAKTVTTSHYHLNGAVSVLDNQTVSLTSADNLTVTTSVDINGDGAYDSVNVNATTLNDDGGRTQTVTDYSGTVGTTGVVVLKKTTKTVSGNGLVVTTDYDLDGLGDGVLVPFANERREIDATVLNADGSKTETITVTVPNATPLQLSQIVKNVSANGLSVTTTDDSAGYGWYQTKTTDETTINANGSTKEVIKTFSNDGSIDLIQTKTVYTNGQTSIYYDWGGNLQTERVDTITLDGPFGKTVLVQNFNDPGQILSQTKRWVSDDGLGSGTDTDADGDGTFESSNSIWNSVDPDGTKRRVNTLYTSGGKLIRSQTDTSSFNGLTETHFIDSDGDGYSETIMQKSTAEATDGSVTVTDTENNVDWTVRSKTVNWTDAAKLHSTITAYDAGGVVVNKTDDKQVQTSGDLAGGTIEVISDVAVNLSGVSIVTGLKRIETTADGLTVTTKIDRNNDGTYESIETKTTSLATDGTQTVSDTILSGGNNLLGSTTTKISGNGLTITTSYDEDGILDPVTSKGTADTVRVQQTSYDVNGNTVLLDTYSNQDGSIRSQSQKTVSANGLSKSIVSDIQKNSDGTTWYFTKEDTVDAILKTGEKTTDVSVTNNSNSLRSLAHTVTSRDGFVKTTTTDVDGDGNVDQLESITRNADGSLTDVRKTYNVSGASPAIGWQQTTKTTGDGFSVTEDTDADGNGVFETSVSKITSISSTDGSKTEIVIRTLNGVLQEKLVTVTSGNGLVVTRSADPYGTGVLKLLSTETTAFNNTNTAAVASSQIKTIANYKADGTSLHDKSVTSVSNDQKTTTVSTDVDGDGKTDLDVITTINADGSVTKTSSDFIAEQPLAFNKTRVVTSADGLTTTTYYDIRNSLASTAYDQSVTVVNLDGSRVITTTSYSAPSTIRDKTITNVSGNGLTTSSTYTDNVNALGVTSHSEQTTLQSNGDKVNTVTNLLGSVQVSKLVTTTSGDGLRVENDWYDGTSTAAQVGVNTKTLNKDGSIDGSNTVRNGTKLLSEVRTKTSASGLVVTTSEDLNGDGTFETVRTDQLVNNDDGSSVRRIFEKDASAKLLDTTTTTVDNTGRFVTISRDNNGDGIIDQIENDVTLVDGTVRKVIADFRGTVIADQTTILQSADGLLTTTSWDLDGNGTVDRIRSDSITNFGNGDILETITDKNADNSIRQKAVVNTTDNGHSKILSLDTDGDGIFEHVETTTVAADKSSKTSALDYDVNTTTKATTLKTTTITQISADGITKTVSVRNASDAFDNHVEVTKVNVNGSTALSFTDYSDATHKSAYGTITTSADGNHVSKETDSVDKVDQTKITNIHKEEIWTRVDGSKVTVARDYDPANLATALMTATTTLNANGLHEETTWSRKDGTHGTIVRDFDSGNAKTALKTVTTSLTSDELGKVVTTDTATEHTIIATGNGSNISVGNNTYTVTVNGNSNNIYTQAGYIEHIKVNGASNYIVVAGTGSDLVETGSGNGVVATASNINLTTNGSNTWISATGNSEVITTNGSGSGITHTGNQSTINSYGASTAIRVYGDSNNIHTLGSATGSYVELTGYNDIAVLDGANSTGVGLGNVGTYYGDVITLNGANSYANIYPTNDKVYSNGSNNQVYLGGYSETVQLTGYGSYINSVGNGNLLLLYGSAERVDMTGSNNDIYLQGGSSSIRVEMREGSGGSRAFDRGNSNRVAGYVRGQEIHLEGFNGEAHCVNPGMRIWGVGVNGNFQTGKN